MIPTGPYHWVKRSCSKNGSPFHNVSALNFSFGQDSPCRPTTSHGRCSPESGKSAKHKGKHASVRPTARCRA